MGKGVKALLITFFFVFMVVIFIETLKPGDREECIIVSRAEAAGVRGGSAAAVPTVPPPVDITLSNIPYIYQHISGNSRTDYYCGLASALMIRMKGRVGSSPYSFSRSQIEYWMVNEDNKLRNHYYINLYESINS